MGPRNATRDPSLPPPANPRDVPEVARLSWGIAFSVSWDSLRRRFGRAMITMLGVILAIAFLTYMLITDDITKALIEMNSERLNLILQENGIDILAVSQTDRMLVLLITLSLITCLVGIVNSMLMSVTERVKEIGTLKCLGARDYFILQTYFIESSLQGIIGTLIGIAGGMVVAILTALINYGGYVMDGFPVLTIVVSPLVALFVGSFISIMASIAPAYWAARKQPVEAMRVEE
jgi:ABC-type lipoprotein release transport system permease subunit